MGRKRTRIVPVEVVSRLLNKREEACDDGADEK